MDGPPPCPWSKKQLRRLGNSIRDEVPPPANGPSYDEVLEWYLELAAFVLNYLETCDWTSLLVGRPPKIVPRVKTTATLRAKLRAQRTFPLHAIHDIAGVRFEANMSLDEQDAVVEAICGYFTDLGASPKRNDLRAEGGHSGYRAIHIILDLPGLVELQVRTHIQGQWANMYEALADVVGRYIRYDELPVDPIERQNVLDFQRLSLEGLSKLEQVRARLDHLADSKEGQEFRTPDGGDLATLRGEFDAVERESLDMMKATEQYLREMRDDVR